MTLLVVLSIALACFVATLILTPLAMHFAYWIGAVDRGGFRKVFQGEMPLLGGLAVATPVVIVCLSAAWAGRAIVINWKYLWLHWRDAFDFLFTLAGNRLDFAAFGIGSLAIVVLGVVDDKWGLPARWKLLGQVAIAAFICWIAGILTTITIPFVGTIDLGLVLGWIVTMFWIVGVINAFNLIDGIDGLASSLSLVSALALLILSVIQGNFYVMFTCAALAGSLTAFLFYNFPPARIFLGDTGSMFLGFTLAVTSLTGSQKSEAAVIILAPVLALSLPIFDTVVSIVRRYVAGMPIFAGDRHHTHHRLLGKGYSQPKVVLLLSGMSVLLTIAAVISALLPVNSSWSMLPVLLYACTLFSIAWLAGYLRPKRIKVLVERRDRNLAYRALGRYAKLRLHGNPGTVEPSALLEFFRIEMGLEFVEICGADGTCIITTRPTNGQLQGNKEQLRVKTLDGQELTICFSFHLVPDEDYRQDVTACLARVFDRVRIDRLRGSDV